MNGKIAVTGASGHVGNVVCRALLAKGYSVKAFYNSDKAALEGLPLELIQGSVLNKEDIEKLLKDCEAVIHCAAIISIHGDPTGKVFETNTKGPATIIEVAQKLGVKKLIHVSSVHAVEEFPSNLPFDENRPYKSVGAYAYDYSKAFAEKIVLKAFHENVLQGAIVRPSSVVGPSDFKPSELGKALIDFYYGRIPAIPSGGYDFVDVREVASSIVAALEHQNNNGEIYLLTGKYYSMKELARLVGKVTGKKVPSFVLPYWLLRLSLPFIVFYGKLKGAAPLFTIESIDALKKGHKNMDHSKAAKQLGHTVRPLEETLRDFYQWQKNQKNIE